MHRILLLLCLAGSICGCRLVGGGDASPRTLSEPQAGHSQSRYTASYANRTLAVPVAFKVDGQGIVCTVTQVNLVGTTVSEATFLPGRIVAREFENVVRSNFHIVSGDERPIAIVSVAIIGSTAKMLKRSNVVESMIRIKVEVSRADGSERCFSKVFTETAKNEWSDKGSVPSSFYSALESVITSFLQDWGCNEANVGQLIAWSREAGPQIVPPSFMAPIVWTEETSASSAVWMGACEIECNDYELSDAIEWANTKIAVASRIQLGDIEPRYVRVVYDKNAEDITPPGSKSKVLRFTFRTFERKNMVLSYDRDLNRGFVIVDVDLMGVPSEQMGPIIEKYIFDEMGKYGGLMNGSAERYKPNIRFLKEFSPDKSGNLKRVEFKLVYVQ